MMHKGHSSTGYAASAVTIAVYYLTRDAISSGHITPGIVVGGIVGAVYSAGMALASDLDHDRSAFTNSAGPVTRILAEGVQTIARHTYTATRLPHDPKPEVHSGEHRGLLHTWPCALTVGALVIVLSALVPYAGPVLLCLGLTPAIWSLAWSVPDRIVLGVNNTFRAARGRRPRDKPRFFLRGRGWAFLYALAITVGVTHAGTVHVLPPVLMGILAAQGMLIHDCGDTLTKQGIPWGWPFPVTCKRCKKAGRSTKCARWVRVSLPARFTIELGGTAEKTITWLSMAAGTAILVVGVLG